MQTVPVRKLNQKNVKILIHLNYITQKKFVGLNVTV